MMDRIKGCGCRLEGARWKALWNNKNDNDAGTNKVKTETLKGQKQVICLRKRNAPVVGWQVGERRETDAVGGGGGSRL